MSLNPDPAEGEAYPIKDCSGLMEVPEVEDCSCHISPPCEACINNPLTCNSCGWTYGESVE